MYIIISHDYQQTEKKYGKEWIKIEYLANSSSNLVF